MAVIIVRPQSSKARRARLGIIAGALLILLFVVWNWSSWRAAAELNTAYAARVSCSCRYVEGRSSASCKGDLASASGMSLVSISDDPETRAVSGHVWLMARRSARLKSGFGCLLDPK